MPHTVSGTKYAAAAAAAAEDDDDGDDEDEDDDDNSYFMEHSFSVRYCVKHFTGFIAFAPLSWWNYHSHFTDGKM